MALPIRDGNQSLTTLSTLIVGSAHIPAHTVVSLGSQAITDIAQAVSGVELGPNSISALEHISVTISAGTSITIGNVVSVTGGLTNAELRASSVTIGGSVQISNFPATQAVSFGNISGSVTATISGTPSVTFSSIQISNFPATQTVTFTQASVTFGTPVVTGSVSVLNFPATQSVTFTTAPVTFGQASTTFGAITGSVSILNFPASQSVTFGQTTVTGQVELGPTSLNALESITVTMGQVTVTGGLTNTELRASAVTIGGTVTANGGDFASNNNAQPSSAIQLGYMTGGGEFLKVNEDGNCFPVRIFTSDGSVGLSDAFIPISGTVTANLSSSNLNSVTIGVRGTVTVGNSVTIGSLPAISGTVTANAGQGFLDAVYSGLLTFQDNEGGFVIESLPTIAGTVTVGNSITIGSSVTISSLLVGTQSGTGQTALVKTDSNGYLVVNVAYGTVTANPTGTQTISGSVTIGAGTAQIGSVTVGNSITIGSIPAISGTVTASIGGFVIPSGEPVVGETADASLSAGVGVVFNKGSVLQAVANEEENSFPTQVLNSVTIGSLPAISGTVTVGNSITIGSFATSVTARLINPAGTAVTYAEVGTAGNPSIDVLSVQGVSGGTAVPISISSVTIGAVPSGTLTTRFGSCTTANTAQISSAVTNTGRKYLLIQNVTTSSNVITIGVGFTPTTTQGIQLSAGAGITFESSYIPTGAVYILSSVTASPFTILEA